MNIEETLEEKSKRIEELEALYRESVEARATMSEEIVFLRQKIVALSAVPHVSRD